METVTKIQEFERDGISFKAKQEYRVDEDGTLFDTGDLSDSNLLARQDAYRKACGLLTSQEIRKIRDLFGLSQKDFSNILGLGDITVTRYETKLVQSENTDRLLRLPIENPLEFHRMFEMRKSGLNLSPSKISFIEAAIAKRASSKEVQANTMEESIKSFYLRYSNEGMKTGNKPLRFKAISQVAYEACKKLALTKTKFAKLLFYIDFYSFKARAEGITGLAYEHQTYGACPIMYDDILCLPYFVKQEVDYLDEDKTVVFIKGKKMGELSPFEEGVVQRVLARFENKTTKDIVEEMHKEKAYQETKQHDVIDYSYSLKMN